MLRLLGALGEDTGFSNPEEDMDPINHAGLEVDLLTVSMPRVVKSPFACEKLAVALVRKLDRADRCLVPMRDLYSAAESRRRRISRLHAKSGANQLPGGIWDAETPEQQENGLAYKFYHLMLTLARYNIPLTLLDFPRLVNDSEYLWTCLSPVFPKIGKSDFSSAFKDLVRPEWVHQLEGSHRKIVAER